MSLTVPSAQYVGLSTDSKPDVDISEAATYTETDTHEVYYWTGTKWKTWRELFKEGRWTAALNANTGSASGIFADIIRTVR